MVDFYADNHGHQRPLSPTPHNCLFEKFFYSLPKQDAAGGHPITPPADDRGFHPSVFSPGVHEDIMKLAADSSGESYDEPEKTTGPLSHPTFRVWDNTRPCKGEERLPEIVLCPFYGCDFRHLVDYTKQSLECEGSWKHHVLNVHWPKGSHDWEVCRWDQCGLSQKSRSSAWKHLAVHVSKFCVKCSLEGCFVYFSRGDRVSQHIREVHMGQRRS